MKYPTAKLPFFCTGVVVPFFLPWAGHWAWWVAAGLSCAAAGWRWRRYAAPLLCAAVFLWGAAYGIARTSAALAQRLPVAAAGEIAVLPVRVLGLPEKTEYGVRFYAKVQDGKWRGRTLLLTDYRGRGWDSGSLWQIEARLKPPVGQVNAAGFNREAWALTRGIDGTGSVRKERTALADNVSGSLKIGHTLQNRWTALRLRALARIEHFSAEYPQGAALTAALGMGVYRGMLPEDWDAFRKLGLTHLVSISGLHVGMAAVFAGGALWWLMHLAVVLSARFAPLRKIFRLPEHPGAWCAFFGLAAALFYALFAGFSVPTQRSVLMIGVGVWHLAFRRYVTAGQIWWRALAAVLLFDPAAVLGAGFWLSFGIVAALVFFSGSRVRTRKSGKVRLFLAAQYAATLATPLFLIPFFPSLPLLSPISNLAAIPWFSALLTPLVLTALCLPGDFVLWCAVVLAQYTVEILRFCADFAPMWAVSAPPLPWLLLSAAALAVLLLPRGLGLRLWACAVFAGLLLYLPPRPPSGSVKITVYDVGQGLAVLVQTASRDLLFDTGHAGAEFSLIPSLHAAGVRGLDALVLSHNDSDHDGARHEIQAAFAVRQIWAGNPAAYAPQHVRHCAADTVWQWDGVHFEFLTPADPSALPPEKAADENGKNALSCVLRVVAGDDALLLTGDLDVAGERFLQEKYGSALFSQILVLGHHGSLTSTSGSFLNTVAPHWGIASAGFANSFGHPHSLVRARLAARGIRLWRTDFSGAAYMTLNPLRPPESVRRYQPYWQAKPVDTDKYLNGQRLENSGI